MSGEELLETARRLEASKQELDRWEAAAEQVLTEEVAER